MDLHNGVELIGRLMMAVLFLISAMGHMATWQATLDECRRAGLPWPKAALIFWTVAELLGGLMLLLGLFAAFAAGVLAVLLLYAVVRFFPFWSAPAEQKVDVSKEFVNRMAIIGGLLVLASHGTGAWSIDRYLGWSLGF